MRLLLDAHTLVWALDDPTKLGRTAREALEDPANELLLSHGTIWELSIKVGLGKLALSLPFVAWMQQANIDLGLVSAAITLEVAARQMTLPWHHRDPFDRLLIAQSLEWDIPIVTADAAFDRYGIVRTWA